MDEVIFNLAGKMKFKGELMKQISTLLGLSAVLESTAGDFNADRSLFKGLTGVASGIEIAATEILSALDRFLDGEE